MTKAAIYHLASGQSFFSGVALVVLAILATRFPASRWSSTGRTVAASVGLILIAASATPLPGWFYGLAGTLTIAWLGVEGSNRAAWRRPGRWLRRAVPTAWLIGAAFELPYHRAPTLPRMGHPPVFVVGDSISAGTGGEAETWPGLLARRHGVEVHDLAMAGAGVEQALRLQAGRVAGSGSLVLAEIGGNDILGDTGPEAFERGLDALLGQLRAGGRTVVMLELPLPPSYNRYGEVQRRLARRHGVFLIPKRVLLGVMTSGEATLDTVHLSPAGHALMAAEVWRILAPAFEPGGD